MDSETVISDLRYLKSFGQVSNNLQITGIAENAIAMLNKQKETINDLTDTIRQLNQHIKDLSEYMTPYGKVRDVKAYAELLKEQPEIVRCKDCQYAEQTMFDDEYCCYYDEENESGCKRRHKGNFFCADGKKI